MGEKFFCSRKWWNFYLTLLLRKVMLDLATNLHKISSKLTIKTPKPHQLTSLQCLYCKLYTHFTTSLVFIPLPLNMKLFAGQLSSFWKDMWEIWEIVSKVVALQIRRKLFNLSITFVFAKQLRRSSVIVKLEAKSCKFTKYWTFYIFSFISVSSSNSYVHITKWCYFYANRMETASAWSSEGMTSCF